MRSRRETEQRKSGKFYVSYPKIRGGIKINKSKMLVQEKMN
jgi:hypothetical protein